MKKKQKRELHLVGYQKNPQGKRVPIYSTKKPEKKLAGASLPGARKKEQA